jgi:hypothetical protein
VSPELELSAQSERGWPADPCVSALAGGRPISEISDISGFSLLATFRRKIEALGCCRRIAQGLENCKVGQI